MQIKTQPVNADKSNATQVASLSEPVVVANTDFFVEYRIERERLYSQKYDFLQELAKLSGIEEEKVQVRKDLFAMIQKKEQETMIENLLRVKGFEDAIITIDVNTVNAMMKSRELTKEEVIQIADIICRVTKVKLENITISTRL